MVEIAYDEIGPEKVLHLYSPRIGLKAFVVVDNTALGPAIGGVRVSTGVSLGEVMRLARTMTMKNSIAGLPHGGGKAGIIADPRDGKKELYFRTFAREISHLVEYIPGPDMGSNEECMAWIRDEIGRAVGLPEEIGGLPLDKVGATGFGLAECAEVACPAAGMEIRNGRVAVQGFGSVGRAAAQFLDAKGALIVGISDSQGTVYDPGGLDIRELFSVKDSRGSVVHYPKGKVLGPEALFSLDCDILIPAATPDVIHAENVGSVKAKVILQGANIPVTREAERVLHERGVLSVPDFIANAGGVIMAAMEYAKKIEKEAFDAISSRIRSNTKLVLEKAVAEDILPREAAEAIARDRVLRAMKYREF